MKLKFGLLILLACSIYSCSKVEGTGGGATIKGILFEQKYNTLGNPISNGFYAKADNDVFLIYGSENTFYDDETKSSYDGSFEFRYLQKGKYKVFVYEDCTTCPSGKQALIYEVEITKRNEVVNLDTITIKKQL